MSDKIDIREYIVERAEMQCNEYVKHNNDKCDGCVLYGNNCSFRDMNIQDLLYYFEEMCKQTGIVTSVLATYLDSDDYLKNEQKISNMESDNERITNELYSLKDSISEKDSAIENLKFANSKMKDRGGINMANVIITGHNNACGYEVGTCKQCGEMGLRSIFKYCPNCGALLDWEDTFSEDAVEYDTHSGLANLLAKQRCRIFSIADGMSEELDSLDASVNCYYREGLKKAAEIIAECIGVLII